VYRLILFITLLSLVACVRQDVQIQPTDVATRESPSPTPTPTATATPTPAVEKLDIELQKQIAQIAEAADLARDVRAALSPAEYEALHARAVDEESYLELAQRLRCSEAVVRKRVSRAVARARAVIGDIDD